MISYELINSNIMNSELKGFYYRYQEFCYKDQDGFAKCTHSNEELAEKMKINIKTLRSRLNELEKLGILSICSIKVKDQETGLLKTMKMIDLKQVCQ